MHILEIWLFALGIWIQWPNYNATTKKMATFMDFKE